jgi:hypothetical protein
MLVERLKKTRNGASTTLGFASLLNRYSRDPTVGITTNVIIEVSEIGRCGMYEARHELRVLCTSRQPFLDGARKLIVLGFDPDATLLMYRSGTQDWALRAVLGVAAKHTVDEHNGTVLAAWKPLHHSAGSARIAAIGSAATAPLASRIGSQQKAA